METLKPHSEQGRRLTRLSIITYASTTPAQISIATRIPMARRHQLPPLKNFCPAE